MSAVAILVGSSTYSHLNPLPCCQTDVEAIAALIEATGRFDALHRFVDLDSAELKRQLRAALEPHKLPTEIFYYFSGHGHSHEGEFYFCPRDFSEKRPNETGLSNSELTALLRESSPELVVKVIDACSSGALLVKSGRDFLPADKGGLKNVVQIASCLDSQTSLAGDPLSEFTDRFCIAASRQDEGPIFYTDIISILRDEYLQDQERSPHFVFQASARETFTEDAARLKAFRDQFRELWADKTTAITDVSPASSSSEVAIAPSAPTFLELLTKTEDKLAKPSDIPLLVNALFDGLKAKLERDTFSECFDVTAVEHSDFLESTATGHIIRVLNHEKRQDEFVTANIKNKRKRSFGIHGFAANLALGLSGDDDILETWDLNLNIRMDRAQLRITFNPKFSILQRLVLVVSCAPSLENCYIFELATSHPRTDWNSFAGEGTELTRRWYKLPWREDVEWLVDKISEKMLDAVKGHVEKTAERLTKK